MSRCIVVYWEWHRIRLFTRTLLIKFILERLAVFLLTALAMVVMALSAAFSLPQPRIRADALIKVQRVH